MSPMIEEGHSLQKTLEHTKNSNVGAGLSNDYTAEGNSNLYKDWARTYDDDVEEEAYMGPSTIIDVLEMAAGKFLDQPQGVRVCDVGCGTALVAEVMRKRVADRKEGAIQYGTLDGFDISEEMIQLAEGKKVLDRAWAGIDLNKPCIGQVDANRTQHGALTAGMYDAMVSCGVWTCGHVRPEALAQALPLLRPGGILIVSVRMSYSIEVGFEAACEAACAEVGAKVAMVCRALPYIAQEGADYYVLQMPQ